MPQSKTKKTKKNILNTSMKLFGENGFYNTSVKDIANAGNISTGLLYNYFDNKDDLLKNIFIEGSYKIKETFETMDSQSTNLQIFIVNIFEVLRKNSKLWKLMHTIKMQKDLVKIFKTELDDITNYIVDILTEYLENKNVKDPKKEALLLFATIDGVSNHYLINKNYPIEQVIKLLISKYK